MIIFIYGPDTYRLSKKTSQIIEEYKKRKSGQEFFVVDAASTLVKDFLAALRQTSLFQEKKFFVVKNPISNKDFKEALIDNMEDIVKSAHTLVFCQEGSVLKNDRLLTVFKKNAEIHEFPPLGGAKLTAWVTSEFKSLGSSINDLAAAELAQRSGNDLWQMSNEVQKLAHRLPGKEVTVRDVENNVDPEVDLNIFRTIDAIAQKDKRQAIELIRQHVGKGDHPLYLLAMIVSQFKNLLLVKSSMARPADIAQRLAVHPYVLRKTMQQSQRFGLEEIKAIYRRISVIDLDIKTGKVDAETGLDLLIAGL